MLRILLDATALLPEPTGVDVYILRLVEALGRVDGDNDYRVLVNAEDRARLSHLPKNLRVVPVGRRPRPARLAAQQLVLPLYAAVCDADVVHSLSFIMPLVRGRSRHVLTVYDMTSFTRPSFHIPLRRSKAYRWAVRASIRRADLVTVPSSHTKRSLIDLVPDVRSNRVRVVAPGISEEFSPRHGPDHEGVLDRLGLPRSYILFVGTIEPRKNLPRVLAAYRQLRRRLASAPDLVLVGRLGWQYDDVLRMLAHPELEGRVWRTGYVRREDLPAIYRGATLFVYPSIEEGFGFPPLEAMACGAPTVASRTSALGEHLRGAARLIDPEDACELAAAMQALLSDERERAALRSNGLERARSFRWELAARETVRCYEAVTRAEGSGVDGSARSSDLSS